MENSDILVSITGKTDAEWKSKLKEIEKYKLRTIALFLEYFNKYQRSRIYRALLKTNIEQIPLVHAKNDMAREEFLFLQKNFNSKYFTIHKNSFLHLKKWAGLHKNLYLELDFADFVPKYVDVSKIGGFCVDLSHFMASRDKATKEFYYIQKRKHIKKYFACNHLNGYSYNRKIDIHTIRKLSDFDYLKEVPDYLFGSVIAIETYNSIAEQLKFLKYVRKILGI